MTTTIRGFSGVVLVALISAGLGCSNQPLSPSALDAPAIGATSAAAASSVSGRDAAPARFGSRTPGMIFVTSQGLYYDTFVLKDPLPMEGKFQLLAGGETEFGPGQAGYLGGRWWVDVNGNGMQDPEDHYFLCPLLPPGRPTPEA